MTCFTSLSDVSNGSCHEPLFVKHVIWTCSRIVDPTSDRGSWIRGLEVPSYGGALEAVSRVGKPPTWTRLEAATILAGSLVLVLVRACQVPMMLR